MNVNFSIDLYDETGCRYDRGIYLFLGEDDATTILKIKNLCNLDYFIQNLQNCFQEIKESYLSKLSEEDQAEYGDI